MRREEDAWNRDYERVLPQLERDHKRRRIEVLVMA